MLEAVEKPYEGIFEGTSSLIRDYQCSYESTEDSENQCRVASV